MIFRNRFERNLVKAELDTSGEYAILRLEADPLVHDKRHDEYALGESKRKDWSCDTPDEVGENWSKADIDNCKKYGLEWAKECMKKNRIRKGIKVFFTED